MGLSDDARPQQLLYGSIERFGWLYASAVPAAATAAFMRSQYLFRSSNLALGVWHFDCGSECGLLMRLTYIGARAYWLAIASLITVAAIGAIAFASATLLRLFSPRELWKSGLGVLLIVAFISFTVHCHSALTSKQVEGFLSLLVSSVPEVERSELHVDVMQTRLIGEGAALMLCLALGGVATFARTMTASELAQRFHSLRALLYVASVLFVLAVMMCHANFSLVFAYWHVRDDAIASAQSSVVTAGVLQAGAAYSSILVAALVPARILLERKAASAMSENELAAWRMSSGIHSTWQAELQQVLAILAPLLAAPVFDSLAKL